MSHKSRWPDRDNLPVVVDNCWLPMKDFPKVKREVQNEREMTFKIRYFVMMRGNGDVVANWYVGKGSGWFFGEPRDFVAWAEIKRPDLDRL